MAMIAEDYVSFETAKLLKEKGFDSTCNGYYNQYKQLERVSLCSVKDTFKSPFYFNRIPAPTLQMAMKWLREVHKISIEITSTGYLIDNDVEWECNIKAGHRLYFKHITGEKSFESVAEKALKYSLENLI